MFVKVLQLQTTDIQLDELKLTREVTLMQCRLQGLESSRQENARLGKTSLQMTNPVLLELLGFQCTDQGSPKQPGL